MLVLSHYQVTPLLTARNSGLATITLSLDLGLSVCEVSLTAEGISFTAGEAVTWPQLAEIAANEAGCYWVEEGQVRLIREFSEDSGRYFSLYPTAVAPTMSVSGIPMHRIKGSDPVQDTRNKVRTVAPLKGHVLDTCTGLGYTAIEAAKTAEQVTTIELDPVAQGVARLNPWSQALFDNPRITQIMGDSGEEIANFADATFTCILHDPPMFNLAGDLYSGAFYRQAYRALKRNGRMFHYIGNPDSASGARVTKGWCGGCKRLGLAGWCISRKRLG
jgi:uncharacterized protein